MTWYPKDFIKVPMTNMSMRPDPSTGYPGRTYRFYNGPKVYEFGYGLSYTNYSYKFVSVSRNQLSLNGALHENAVKKHGSAHSISVSELSCNSLAFSARVRVTNHGKMAGKHPALLFVKRKNVGSRNPIKKLVGFKSVRLRGGESEEIKFVVNPCEHLSFADEDGLMVIEEGALYFVVGDEEHPFNVVF